MREAYRRKLEILMRDVGDMSRAVAIMEADRGTALRVTPDELFAAFQALSDENTRVRDGGGWWWRAERARARDVRRACAACI